MPLLRPGAAKTLMPTVSFVETRLLQANATVAFPVKFVMPQSTIL